MTGKELGEESAFPGPVVFDANRNEVQHGGAYVPIGGMTKLEYFTAAAFSGFIAQGRDGEALMRLEAIQEAERMLDSIADTMP